MSFYKYVHADEINVTRDRPKGVSRQTLDGELAQASSPFPCGRARQFRSPNPILLPGLNSNPQNGSRFHFRLESTLENYAE